MGEVMDSDSVGIGIGTRCGVVMLNFACGLAGLLLVLLHEWFIITLLALCYTVALSTVGLVPPYCFDLPVPIWALWTFMYLLTSNSFEFHLFIEAMPNVALDQIRKCKQRARFLVVSVPKLIFMGILLSAFSQLYFQYWSIKKRYVVKVKARAQSNYTQVDTKLELEPAMDWSIYIFATAFFYVIYTVPLGSDWVYYRRKTQVCSGKFRLAYFQNLLVCVLHEIRLVFWTLRSPIFPFLLPATLFLYRLADSPPFFFCNAMILGFCFSSLFATRKSFDLQFKPSPYTIENSILARNILLQYGYFPAILYLYLKDGPADIFGYQLSIPQDFVLYTFALYLSVWQTIRICTCKLQVDPEGVEFCTDIEAGKILRPHPDELKLIGIEIDDGLGEGESRALVLDEHGAIPVLVEGPSGPQLKKLVLVD